MKLPTQLSVALLFLLAAVPPVSAGNASASWTGLMLQFNVGVGVETQAGQTYLSQLSLDTVAPPTLLTGLLKIDNGVHPAPWRAWGFYRIESVNNPRTPGPRIDDFVVELPNNDADADGVPDILEIEKEVVAAQTTGSFEDQGVAESVNVIWSRASGSESGQTIIQMSSSGGSANPLDYVIDTYTNTFSLTRLAGTLTYQSGASHATGIVALARTNPQFSFEGGSGLVNFTKTDADHLMLADGQLSYYGNDQVKYRAASEVSRFGTNYWAIAVVTNGTLGSLDSRFQEWLWRFSDPTDRDQNGIPDLSDLAPAFPARLNLRREGSNLRLTVAGESDAAYALDHALTLEPGTGAWMPDGNLLIPSSGETNLVRSLNGQNGFWRVRNP